MRNPGTDCRRTPVLVQPCARFPPSHSGEYGATERAENGSSPEDRRNSATWLAHARAFVAAPALVHRLVLADGSHAEFETRVRPMQRADRMGQVVAVSRDVRAHSRG